MLFKNKAKFYIASAFLTFPAKKDITAHISRTMDHSRHNERASLFILCYDLY